jgi:hypothetical protein
LHAPAVTISPRSGKWAAAPRSPDLGPRRGTRHPRCACVWGGSLPYLLLSCVRPGVGRPAAAMQRNQRIGFMRVLSGRLCSSVNACGCDRQSAGRLRGRRAVLVPAATHSLQGRSARRLFGGRLQLHGPRSDFPNHPRRFRLYLEVLLDRLAAFRSDARRIGLGVVPATSCSLSGLPALPCRCRNPIAHEIGSNRPTSTTGEPRCFSGSLLRS